MLLTEIKSRAYTTAFHTWQEKSKRFARASLGDPDNVPVLQGGGPGLCLDDGRFREARLSDALHHSWWYGRVFEPEEGICMPSGL